MLSLGLSILYLIIDTGWLFIVGIFILTFLLVRGKNKILYFSLFPIFLIILQILRNVFFKPGIANEITFSFLSYNLTKDIQLILEVVVFALSCLNFFYIDKFTSNKAFHIAFTTLLILISLSFDIFAIHVDNFFPINAVY